MERKFLADQKQYEHRILGDRKRSTHCGFGKLVLLSLLGFFLWRSWQEPGVLNGLGVGLSLLCSIPLWLYHGKVTDRIQESKGLAAVAGGYCARIRGEWSGFPEDGREFVGESHPYSSDLDLFGPRSLFQLLNVSGTIHGQKRLAADLAAPDYTPEEILARQKAVKELSRETGDGFRYRLSYLGEKVKKQEDFSVLMEKLTENRVFFRSPLGSLLFRCLPLATAAMCIAAVAGGILMLRRLAVGLLGMQMLLWLGYAIKTHRYLAGLASAKRALAGYEQLFSLVVSQNWQAPLLRSIQERLSRKGAEAGKAIQALDRIGRRIALRGNALLYLLCNLLFLWDVNTCRALADWRRRYGDKLPDWFQALGELEALTSLSVLNRTVAGISFPVPIRFQAGRESVPEKLGSILKTGDYACGEAQPAVVSKEGFDEALAAMHGVYHEKEIGTENAGKTERERVNGKKKEAGRNPDILGRPPDRVLLYGTEIGHPLIPNEKRVCNDFTLGAEICVISGSNMSGKTTFLRSLGINLVLSQAGAGVCAKVLYVSPLRLMTSMRVADDLHQGVSTFYAELRRIKEIVSGGAEQVNQEKRLLFLIDEIFRGTNGADRLAGAKAVMKKLSDYGAAGLLTTHDLGICEGAPGLVCQNYHFSEGFDQGTLTFDYKIKPGMTQTTNGRYLMEMLGLLDP